MDDLTPTFEVIPETGALVVTTPKEPEIATYTAEQIEKNIADLQSLIEQTQTNIAFWQDLENRRVELLPQE